MTSSAAISLAENKTAVTTVKASDPEKGASSYAIVGGADKALFVIDAKTGALSFKSAPNFETPKNSGKDNIYDVTVKVTDAGGLAATQALKVSVTDTFIFKSVKELGKTKTATDTIFDFNGKGGDRIDVSGIDADVSTTKDDAFNFIGAKAFSKKAGELRYDKEASDTYIYGDTNGDGKADFVIHLDDALTMSKGYFLL